jgi:hypothetical protein
VSDHFNDAQQRLGRLMARAASGEDRAMARWVRETGERMVRMLLGMVRMAQYHELDNQAFDRPSEELSQRLAEVLDKLGVAAMVFVEDQVYLNDIRVRYDPRQDLGVEMSRHFADFGVGGLTFNKEIPPADFRRLLGILSTFEGDRAALSKRLAEAGFEHVALTGVHRFLRAGEESKDKGSNLTVEQVQQAAQRSVDTMLLRASQNRIIDLLQMRKLANNMVDQVDAGSMAETGSRRPTSLFAVHCITVGQIAVSIGRELGMSEPQQADLVVCALTHDIGYGAREDGFSTPFERHASAGARTLLQRRGFHEGHLRRVLAVLEHHDRYRREDGTRPGLYARIIRVADDYDTLTRARGGAPRIPPVEVLEAMAGAAGTTYDPVVVQALVNVLGRYPPGTAVLLSNKRVGATLSMCRGPELWERPTVRLLHKVDGQVGPSDEILDLAETPDVHILRAMDTKGALFLTDEA